jgi:hypothetical protein
MASAGEQSVPSINANGFNRSFSRVEAYGHGIYFASKAELSATHRYAKPNTAGLQSMYLARVLVGHSCVGNREHRQPPERTKGVPFDSLVETMVRSFHPTFFPLPHRTPYMHQAILTVGEFCG